METQEFVGAYTSPNRQGYTFWTYGFDIKSARNNAHRLHGGSSVFNWDEAISRAEIKPFKRRGNLSPLDKLPATTA